MSRLVFDGNYKVFYVPGGVATASSPSLAAMTAGTDITAYIPKDGFNPGVTNNRVGGGSLEDTFMDESMGTWSSQLQITCYKDTADGGGAAFETIGVHGTTGGIVVVPYGPEAVGKDAYVWGDIECGEPAPTPSAENTRQKFIADLAVRAAPDMHAVVVA